ncbi:MAG: hypothetical protein AB7P40_06500 [Chloroflexota bacterium]
MSGSGISWPEGRCLAHAALVSALVLALYALWFVVQDRRIIFLYGHLNSTPFDLQTASRYWMTGLVASGAMLVVHTSAVLLTRMAYRSYRTPDWAVVWQYSSLLLALPVLGIVALAGTPRLPPLFSAWALVVLLTGLRLALYASHCLVTDLRRTLWYFFDGLALVPVLILLPLAVEFGVRRSMPALVIVGPAMMVFIALAWLGMMTFVYQGARRAYPSPLHLLLSGLTTSYLLLPLYHYVTSRPDRTIYISNSSNFLAAADWLQVVVFLVTAGMVLCVNHWRTRLTRRDVASVARVLLVLHLLIVGRMLTGYTLPLRETDIWICQDGQWVPQGSPPYARPFDDPCGQR